MSLIDHTFFHSELVIPNIAISDSTTGQGFIINSVTNKTVQEFINKYEAEFLRKLLGKELRNAFLKGLKTQPADKLWETLRELLIDTENRISPIANYVYYWYKRDETTFSTGIGDVKPTQSDAINSNSSRKMVKAYNDMCDLIEIFYSSIKWENYKAYSGNFMGYDWLLGVRLSENNF